MPDVPDPAKPISIAAPEAPPRPRPARVPSVFSALVTQRVRRPLGDLFGLTRFGVIHTTIAPGGQSSLHHAHARQDEFVYVLAGTPTLVTDAGDVLLVPGDCAGFAAGQGAHHLENRTAEEVAILEIGDRTPDDAVSYPRDDVAATLLPDGTWQYTTKDGRPY